MKLLKIEGDLTGFAGPMIINPRQVVWFGLMKHGRTQLRLSDGTTVDTDVPPERISELIEALPD